MPIYEYSCGDCQSKFELLRGFSRADDPAECPACGTGHGSRLVSRFASFSKSSSGEVSSVVGGGCSGCAATSCATCH